MNDLSVPKYNECFYPVLCALKSESAMRSQQVRSYVARQMNLSAEELREMLPSQRQPTFHNRVHWALMYLRKAGLVENVSRGVYKITPDGLAALQEAGDQIDLAYLERFRAFREFIYGKPGDGEVPPAIQRTELSETPQDIMDRAYGEINDSLCEDLLSEIMNQTPAFFENLVVELLLRMGYGGALDDAGRVVGKSGDEGIDGIIREDKLGFSSIYIQAKRWDLQGAIGRPEIQKFVGALAGQGASKGLFITTGQFTREAREFVGKQRATKVVLVDGAMLAKLMIEYDLGVSTQRTYFIKKLDNDYFDDRNE